MRTNSRIPSFHRNRLPSPFPLPLPRPSSRFVPLHSFPSLSPFLCDFKGFPPRSSCISASKDAMVIVVRSLSPFPCPGLQGSFSAKKARASPSSKSLEESDAGSVEEMKKGSGAGGPPCDEEKRGSPFALTLPRLLRACYRLLWPCVSRGDHSEPVKEASAAAAASSSIAGRLFPLAHPPT